MYKIDLNKLNVNETEVKAYLQQQMMELAPHIDPSSAVALKLAKRDDLFQVELETEHNFGKIQTLGQSEDLFAAIRNAKEGLLQYFIEIEDQMDPEGRERRIHHIQQGGNFYLH